MRFHELEDALVGERVLSDARARSAARALIQTSVKFFVGDVSGVPDAPFTLFPRLPFARSGFEFTQQDDGDRLCVYIVLCEEIDDGVVLSMYARVDREWRALGGYHLAPDRITIRTRYQSRPGSGGSLALRVLLTLTGQTLEVLNCRNVTTETVCPPPALNAKRIQKHRPPLYDYKVLTLKRYGTASRKLSAGQGTSPRIHLRRGHIKRRKTGNFWWEPCMVVGRAPHGLVVKDYDLSELGCEHR